VWAGIAQVLSLPNGATGAFVAPSNHLWAVLQTSALFDGPVLVVDDQHATSLGKRLAALSGHAKTIVVGGKGLLVGPFSCRSV
jgi:hypothetical protein